MAHHGCETDFELTTIERLQSVGYRHVHGSEVDRQSEQEVAIRSWLATSLRARYPDLPDASLDDAVERIARPSGVDTLRRNMAFHEVLTRGLELKIEHKTGPKSGQTEHRHIHPVGWDDPTSNDFRVVNQLSIRGQNDRRPDVIVYINGLPLVVFELKNPWDDKPTVDQALNQIGHYRHDIPQLFEYNGLTVISDGNTTLHGMWTADLEWFAPWKSIDGVNVEANTTGSMKSLVEGLFQKERLLAYLRHFIVFQVFNDKISKKGAKYHQFFAVRKAAEGAIAACRPDADRRIGVIWHTTGSGKSLSMIFLVGILRGRSELANPSFVIQVDSTDIDDQLNDEFVAARQLVGDVRQAHSIDDLRRLLATEGGEVIFSTIQKFQLRGGEISHPLLSRRSNIIVIADEAHRSQYGFLQGYARYLSEALPNARRIGFTGTPISFAEADTVAVFGDLIHTYDIRQGQEDKATVPIYYAPRQIKLHLGRDDVDEALEELKKGRTEEELANLPRALSRWAALAAAAGATERVRELSKDLLAHYLDRSKTLSGKAMVVCMTRANCVTLYDALTALPGCPEVKVIMTGDLGRDPPAWSAEGHITTKSQRDSIKARMKDPNDPLKIVIVCDMWLTGTDIPCLHTLYLDKPMKGHTMVQAISRVNRVFRDKPHGLIVDYIGVGDELREATAKYSKGGGRGDPAPNIDEARTVFLDAMEAVRESLPEADYAGWRKLSAVALEDLYSMVWGTLTDDEARRDVFLSAEWQLSRAYLLVKHFSDLQSYADELIFYQRVRKQLLKAVLGDRPKRDLEEAVKDLVDDAVESEGVVDIFKAAGLDKVDISILDDKFLQTFKERPHENLRLQLLEQLMKEEFKKVARRNPARARSFQEMLQKTLQNYHNRLVDAAAVVKAMIDIRNQADGDKRRAKLLGLGDDELAFYDAVAENYATVYDEQFLSGLIHDVVHNIKKNLKVDWTEEHRADVRAAVRAAVKRVLARKGVKEADFEPFLQRFMEQAEVLYENWPVAA
jgi:type I restriction enzyme R subunit